MEFKAATLFERKNFYEKFDLGKVKNWFKSNGMKIPKICAIDAGSDSGIIADKKLQGFMFYFPFFELKEKIKKYIPEDIYYDRNVYENPARALKNLSFDEWKGQELAFDIDADNFSCLHKGKKVCKKCLRKAFEWSLKLKKYLKRKGFRKSVIVYSGKGFHVHVLDKKTFFLSRKKRKQIVSELNEYHIDDWVSEGNISLIRLPFSLNAEVSMRVIPVRENKLNKKFFEKAIPKFS